MKKFTEWLNESKTINIIGLLKKLWPEIKATKNMNLINELKILLNYHHNYNTWETTLTRAIARANNSGLYEIAEKLYVIYNQLTLAYAKNHAA